RLFGPDTPGQVSPCPALAKDFPAAGIQVTVKGDNTYGGASSMPPVEFTPKEPGTYHWVAEYAGDPPNTKEATHNTHCSNPKESVTVARSATKPTPEESNGTPISAPLSIGKGTVGVEDKAEVTVEGTSTWSGTVQFELCGPIAPADTSQTCDGKTNVGTKIGGANPVSNGASTVTSPLVTITSAGEYCWRAVVSDGGGPTSADSTPRARFP